MEGKERWRDSSFVLVVSARVSHARHEPLRAHAPRQGKTEEDPDETPSRLRDPYPGRATATGGGTAVCLVSPHERVCTRIRVRGIEKGRWRRRNRGAANIGFIDIACDAAMSEPYLLGYAGRPTMPYLLTHIDFPFSREAPIRRKGRSPLVTACQAALLVSPSSVVADQLMRNCGRLSSFAQPSSARLWLATPFQKFCLARVWSSFSFCAPSYHADSLPAARMLSERVLPPRSRRQILHARHRVRRLGVI
ncbi:hypothetical protein MPH_12689 [Macrophomina phaseolina MS6]|uniref:Uncharacterized protein n=1 Tax=Macrophomina phaseolina (strain MS6) TaxID=1126212 RepID=K2RJD6_MACPH|nr:hypothetical protein MPH_12689 [Macrophomina phaseolina MS6]